MLPQTEVVKFQAIKAEEKEIAKRLEELVACEAERAEAELLERAVVWSRVEDAKREEEAVSARIAAAQAAKAQAEARRQGKQAEVDACELDNRSEVRSGCLRLRAYIRASSRGFYNCRKTFCGCPGPVCRQTACHM